MTVEVDGEAVGLQFGEAEVTLGPPTSGPSVRLATDGATILDLIAGRTSLVDAALAERCRIFGSVPALEAFHRSLITYLKGAVRCPSFPWLLREYQQQRGGTGTARQEHLS